jgi:hypothetical protein
MFRRSIAATALVWGTLAGVALAAPPEPNSPSVLSIASGTSLLEPGSSVLVSWPAGTGGGAFDEMELVLSLDGGRSFPVRVTRRIAPADGGVSWMWIVPSLPAAHARLALRAGVDERDEAETVVGLTEDFAIAAPVEGGFEELFRVGEEERTRDALEEPPPPRLPESALGGVPELVAGFDPLEATGPGPSPDSALNRVRAQRGPEASSAPRASSRKNPQPIVASVRLPMRL